MKTLILFSTRDGQTREIASYLASELKELGIQADVANVHRIEEPQWENYDRVVIGASIRYGHYHSAFLGLLHTINKSKKICSLKIRYPTLV